LRLGVTDGDTVGLTDLLCGSLRSLGESDGVSVGDTLGVPVPL
jgi:hypothetical protein